MWHEKKEEKNDNVIPKDYVYPVLILSELNMRMVYLFFSFSRIQKDMRFMRFELYK